MVGASFAPARSESTTRAWAAVLVLTIYYALSIMDRYAISMLVEPIRQDLGIGDFEVSLLMGPGFAISYALASLPWGLAADRLQRRTVIFGGVTGWSLATAASGLTSGFGGLLAARCGVAAFEAALIPSAHSLIADKIPKTRLALAMATFSMGAKLGSAISFVLIGALLSIAANLHGTGIPVFGELAPWRTVMIWVGLLGLPLAFLAWTFSEPPRQGRAAEILPGAETAAAFVQRHWRFFVYALLGFSLTALVGYAIVSWTPTFLARRYGLTPLQYGAVLSFASTASAVTLLAKGWIMDRLFAKGQRDTHIRFYSWLVAGSLPFACVLYLSPDATLFLVGYTALQIVTLPYVIYASSTIQLVMPNELRGRTSAVLMGVTVVLGLGIGPTAVGALTDFVFRDESKIGWSLATVVTVGLSLCLVFLRLSLRELGRILDEREPQPGA